ncbi:MAG: hypothetical protein RLZZ312_1838 [Bacteroidota bacterium]|jgi:MFS family permease
MKETLLKIEKIKQEGFYFGFGEIFDQTIQNYKKIIWVQGFVILLIILLFTVVIGSVAGLAVGVGSLTEYFTEMQVNGVGTVALLVQLLVGIIGAGIAAPFTAGLLKMAHLAEQDKDFGFSTAFDYYKSPYLKELFLCGIYVAIVTSGLATIVAILSESYSFLKTPLGIFNVVFSIVAPILTIFSIPLVVFGNLSAVNAIQGSVAAAKQKFWTILLLGIIFLVCLCFSIFAFCIGIFFAIPLAYSLEYIMYKTAFGINDKSELDDIGLNQ